MSPKEILEFEKKIMDMGAKIALYSHEEKEATKYAFEIVSIKILVNFNSERASFILGCFFILFNLLAHKNHG